MEKIVIGTYVRFFLLAAPDTFLTQVPLLATSLYTMLRQIVLALALGLGLAGEFNAPSVSMNLRHDK